MAETRRQWELLRAEKWRLLGTELRRIVRSGGTPDLDALPPGVANDYRVWLRADREVGPSQGSVESQRAKLYLKRREWLSRLPEQLRATPAADLPQQYDWIKDGLEDVEWRLAKLRTGPPKPPPDNWETCCDPAVLRRRLLKYERRLRLAGGHHANTPVTNDLVQTIERITDRKRALEIDEYESRLREWEFNRKEDPYTYHAKTKPKRPGWLMAEEQQSAIQERRDRRINKPLAPLAPDPHRVRLERAALVSARRHAREAEHSRARFEARMCKLLDWVWGEARIMHIGMLVDGDMYIDADRILYSAKRQDVLEACAVRVSTGWVFPAATGNGRVR